MSLINCANTTTNTSNYSCGKLVSSSNSSLPSYSVNLFRPFQPHHQRSIYAVKTASQESYGPDLLRKPIVTPPPPPPPPSTPTPTPNSDGFSGEDRWLNWEDRILEDTVPLVGFVRMILHSGKYKSGDRLNPEHEATIPKRLLPNHPECEKKIGCGIDYITIGYHPQFEESRCLFIVRKDGELEDFSYWKCIKGFIRTHYPQYAEKFILKHFRRRRRYD